MQRKSTLKWAPVSEVCKFRHFFVSLELPFFPFCKQMSSFLPKLPSALQMAWTRAGRTTQENLCVMQNNFSPRDPAKSLFIEQERPCKNTPFYQLLMLHEIFASCWACCYRARPPLSDYAMCVMEWASVCVHVHPPKSTRRDAIFRFFVTLAASKVWSSWQPACQKWVLRDFGGKRARNNNFFRCICPSHCMTLEKNKESPFCG